MNNSAILTSYSENFKKVFKWVLGIHILIGLVGLFGLLIVPLSKESATFGGQLIGAAAIFAWVFVTSLLVWYVLKLVMGIRVSEEAEYEGVDASECGIEAYPEFVASVK